MTTLVGDKYKPFIRIGATVAGMVFHRSIGLDLEAFVRVTPLTMSVPRSLLVERPWRRS